MISSKGIEKYIKLSALAVLTSLVSCSGVKEEISPTTLPTGAIAKGQNNSKAISELLRLMNNERRKRGLKLLVLDLRLTRAAQKHSDSMYQHGYFAHIDKKGRNFQKRILKEGYPRCYSAENLALAGTPSLANSLWLRSPGHRKNLLGKKYTRVGIGKAGRYWTANYAETMGTASINATLPPPAYSHSGGF